MNLTLMLSYWRQRLVSPIRVALLGALFGMPLLGVAFMHGAGLSVLGDSTGLVLVFAVGMIGQDVSSGVLQLLFARPVRRPEYVWSRWLATGLAAAAVGVLQVALAVALLSARGAAPPAQEAALFAGQRVLECFGLAAVFALLSSLIGGVGDLALYFLGTVGGGVLQMAGGAMQQPAVARAGNELMGFVTPKLDLAQIVSASPLPLFPIASYLSTVALCLALAMVVVNRKELSYASGG
jgi:ABC-type transport system involved in multi-copper enzyme maturation permease subunit